MSSAAYCTTCEKAARLTDGREVYPHRPDLYAKNIWKCDGCGGRVGCHPGSTKPLGTCADIELRQARMRVHARLDPLWQTADAHYKTHKDGTRPKAKALRRQARSRVYEFVAFELDIQGEACHTGLFTLDDCADALSALEGVTYPQIREWAEDRNLTGSALS